MSPTAPESPSGPTPPRQPRRPRSAGAVLGWVGVLAVATLTALGAALVVVTLVSAGFDVFSGVSPAVRRQAEAAASHEDDLISPTASLDSADALVQQSVARRVVPGAVVAIGDSTRIIRMAGYGREGWSPRDQPVSPDSTQYDLASLTKAVATTTAVLLLVQDGKIDLDTPVQRVLPDFDGVGKNRITWRMLMTHTSGLPPSGRMRGKTPAQRLRSLLRTRLAASPGSLVQYSDLSYVTLWAAAERVAGEPLPHFLDRRVWKPLGMASTAFWPGTTCLRCAPTLVLSSGQPYRGKPSDPIAHGLGVPTGNAGLFSTAHDLARYMSMIANGGTLDGQRILRPDLVDSLFVQIPHAGHRTLGWEAFCPPEHPTQQQRCEHPVAYGHTGWTGTSIWIDPARGVWVVILSNRSYDVKHLPSLDELRQNVFLDVARAASLDTVPAVKPDATGAPGAPGAPGTIGTSR